MTAPLSIRAMPSVAPKLAESACEHGDPCSLVLFGATGDLAKRKLIPALYDMFRSKLLAEDFRVIGVDRNPMTDDEFRELCWGALNESEEVKGIDAAVWGIFRQKFFFVSGDLTQRDVFTAVGVRLHELEGTSDGKRANRLFYLSVPPVIFEPIVRHLDASGLSMRTESPASRPWSRIIVEKPFGHSLDTALELNKLVLGVLNEHQIFRIDHYLGKETVQNILVFRAANAIFEPLWNRTHIAHVQITAAETVGVELRGGYYEAAGVVRDMFQNHLLQLLALTAMELPTTMSAQNVRDEKVKALRAVRPLLARGIPDAVRAQYAAGELKGHPLPAYRGEPRVSPTSVTPTYAALRVMIDNGRWRGVPFYLRSGKRMAKRVSEISVQFRTPPYLMDGLVGAIPGQKVQPNVLTLRVQPDDGISLSFEAKIPGAAYALTPETEVTSVMMNFDYKDAFGAEMSPAYETLLLDCMIDDATLFTRSDEVETGWRITDPLLEYWEANPPESLPTYAAGSWGPRESDELLARDGFAWRTP